MTDNTELIAEARVSFLTNPGYDLGVDPGSPIDLVRRLADALESRDAEVQQLRDVIEEARDHEWSTYGKSTTYGILASAPVALPETTPAPEVTVNFGDPEPEYTHHGIGGKTIKLCSALGYELHLSGDGWRWPGSYFGFEWSRLEENVFPMTYIEGAPVTEEGNHE